jgi:large subunit ribosomal protein L24
MMKASKKKLTTPLHVKTGDNVMVISGKDAGKSGKILSAYPREGRVLVAGVNMATKHKKPRGLQQPGGIIHQEAPIYASKVMLVCPACQKPTRIANKINDDGSRARTCKKCGKPID